MHNHQQTFTDSFLLAYSEEWNDWSGKNKKKKKNEKKRKEEKKRMEEAVVGVDGGGERGRGGGEQRLQEEVEPDWAGALSLIREPKLWLMIRCTGNNGRL